MITQLLMVEKINTLKIDRYDREYPVFYHCIDSFTIRRGILLDSTSRGGEVFKIKFTPV